MKIAKNIFVKYPIYVSKQLFDEKHVESLLIGGEKKHVLINDFNRFIYDYSFHRERKHLCRYYLYAFITEKILKRHIKDSFKINGRHTTKMPKKGEHVKFKNFEIKIKSPLMIYADFEGIMESIMESKTRMSLILTNIKNMLLAVMVIN